MRQAQRKIEEELTFTFPFDTDRDMLNEAIAEQVEGRALELIDRQGLWRRTAPRRPSTDSVTVAPS